MLRSHVTAALAFALALALPGSSAAQVGLEATVVPAFESLSPEGSAKESRGTIDGGLDAEALFASERGRVFYALDAGTFSTPGDWSFLQHDAGMTWRLGDTSGPHVFLGASGTLRRNGDAWAAADYDAVGAKANFVWSPRAGLTLRAGARADARRFGEIPALDQVEGRGFASVLANLPSRTTLIGEVVLGGKSYAGETILVPVERPRRPARGAGAGRERKGCGRDGARPASGGRPARDRGRRERRPAHLARARRAVAGPPHRPLARVHATLRLRLPSRPWWSHTRSPLRGRGLRRPLRERRVRGARRC